MPTALAALFGSVFLVIAGNGLVSTLIPLRAKLENFSEVSIGLLGSVYFLGMLAGTLVAPAVVRWSGHIRAFVAFVAIAIVVVLSYPVIVDPVAWITLRAVIGFAFAGLYAVIEGWVNAKADNTNRGQAYALYQVAHFGGSASGQQILALAPTTSFALFSATAGLFALATLPLAFTKADPPGTPHSVRVRIGWLMRMAPVAGVTSLLIGAANGSFWSLAPIYALDLKLSAGQVGAMMTAVIVGSAVGVYPVGRLSDRLDRRLVLAWLAAAGALVEAALSLIGAPPLALLLALMFLIGATTMTLYSIASSHANDRTGAGHSVEIASGLLFLYCVGAIVMPTFAAWLMAKLGPQALMAQNVLLHGAIAGFAVWRMAKRVKAVPVPPDDKATKPPVP